MMLLSINRSMLRSRLSATRPYGKGRNQGFTLVELMVAMIISLLIVIVATSVFVFTRQSFNSNDAASQINDSARFGIYLLRRIVEQAGYEDLSTNGIQHRANDDSGYLGTLPVCYVADVCGYDNGIPANKGGASASSVNNGTSPISGTLTGANGYESDTLVIRYQGQSDSTGKADGSIIDCFGTPQSSPTPTAPAVDSRSVSVLYVWGDGTKDPELRCGYAGSSTPLIKGVEAFQVLYGVDTSDPDAPGANGLKKAVPTRYVRADEMATVGSLIKNPNAERADLLAWRNVRAVRIGMVIRGAPGTGTPSIAPINLFPLGEQAQSANDLGSVFTPPSDTRLRRVVNFTVYIRNNLERPSS